MLTFVPVNLKRPLEVERTRTHPDNKRRAESGVAVVVRIGGNHQEIRFHLETKRKLKLVSATSSAAVPEFDFG